MALIIFIIGRLFGNLSTDVEDLTSSLYSYISSLLISIVLIIFQFMLARGLIYNRMGSIGEYMDNINYLKFKTFGVCFVIMLIPYVALATLGASVASALTADMMVNGEISSLSSLFGLAILVLIGQVIYGAFTYYRYFLAADHPQASFGELFKNTFKLGKNLFGKTIKTYLKWYILPVIIFALLAGLITNTNKGMTRIGILSILSIVFVIYAIISSTIVLGELSNHYLDYNSNVKYEDNSVVYES
jgi:hypothetical protein